MLESDSVIVEANSDCRGVQMDKARIEQIDKQIRLVQMRQLLEIQDKKLFLKAIDVYGLQKGSEKYFYVLQVWKREHKKR